MANLMNFFFGPLNKEYCLYFYVLSIIFGITFLLLVIGVLIVIIKDYKKIDLKIGFNLILLLINAFLVYFVNRLLYSMCSRSLA